MSYLPLSEHDQDAEEPGRPTVTRKLIATWQAGRDDRAPSQLFLSWTTADSQLRSSPPFDLTAAA
jgi:hypothetical protein